MLVVLFLLSCAACDYGTREARRLYEEQAAQGLYMCGDSNFPSEWGVLAAILFIASISAAGGGAMRLWRVEFEGEADVRALVLNIEGEAAGNAGAIETTQEAALEEVPALSTASLPSERAQHFAHFDEQGRSPLERVLAQY